MHFKRCTFSFLVSLVVWRLRMEGFVSNEWLRRLRFALAIAAAAATPTGPKSNQPIKIPVSC